MPLGRKQGAGCWTCRLRRKRCDSVRPVCGSCRGLDIPCHTGGESRPAWMDGGDGQQRMARMIKQTIKRNALLRKERRLGGHENRGMVVTTASDFQGPTDGVRESGPPATIRTGISVIPAPGLGNSESNVGNNLLPPSISSSVKPESPFAKATSASRAAATDNGCSSGLCRSIFASSYVESVTATLDFVWPFIFPFYRPLFTDIGIMGRQWLLSRLHQDEFTFHVYQSMCEYLLSLIARNDSQELECDCKALVWERLVEKTNLASRGIKDTVAAFWQQGANGPLSEKTRIMGSIAQLLFVELTVRRDFDWATHLTPALTIFDGIFKHHGVQHSGPSLAAVLDELAPASSPTPIPEQPGRKTVSTTEDQSAFVFHSALLLFYDIVASTALGNAPVLQSYHCTLLSIPSEERFPVRLESLVGCQNWALVAIGRISTLCAWKRDAKQSGNFSVFKFVNLARPISEALEDGLASLDNETQPQSRASTSSRRKGYYRRHDRAVDGTPLETVTRIWAHAAKLYLSVTLSGWQPGCDEVQHSVAEVLRLLQTIESPAQLQSLTWPMCVAGCLALPDQDQDFRAIVEDIGALAEFGTMLSALRIMGAVWGTRGTVDRDSWDVASALNILGSPSLLV
ncbi:C6 transcription factor [Apiospora marii]|uniref:C6 transcription factor n=1 Tax=Apiospora marii TaxID=335849 RepID=UPI003131F9B3